MNRLNLLRFIILLTGFLYLLSFVSVCGDNNVECGPGTTLIDGQCRPYCGPGTYLDEDGFCKPINGADGDSDSDGDSDGDSDSDGDGDVDVDGDSDGDSDGDGDTDSDGDVDGDSDNDASTGCNDNICSNLVEEMYGLLLQDREAQCGANSLTLVDALTQAAKEISDNMATQQSLQVCTGTDLQALLDSYGVVYSYAGHFCGGAYGSVEIAHNAFYNDERIRNNYILNCRFTQVGIGITPDPNAPSRIWIDIILVDPD